MWIGISTIEAVKDDSPGLTVSKQSEVFESHNLMVPSREDVITLLAASFVYNAQLT